jgi:hypothetical protein
MNGSGFGALNQQACLFDGIEYFVGLQECWRGTGIEVLERRGDCITCRETFCTGELAKERYRKARTEEISGYPGRKQMVT